jgi:hypothetical protein
MLREQVPLVLDTLRVHILEWSGLTATLKNEFFQEVVLGKV